MTTAKVLQLDIFTKQTLEKPWKTLEECGNKNGYRNFPGLPSVQTTKVPLRVEKKSWHVTSCYQTQGDKEHERTLRVAPLHLCRAFLRAAGSWNVSCEGVLSFVLGFPTTKIDRDVDLRLESSMEEVPEMSEIFTKWWFHRRKHRKETQVKQSSHTQ